MNRPEKRICKRVMLLFQCLECVNILYCVTSTLDLKYLMNGYFRFHMILLIVCALGLNFKVFF